MKNKTLKIKSLSNDVRFGVTNIGNKYEGLKADLMALDRMRKTKFGKSIISV